MDQETKDKIRAYAKEQIAIHEKTYSSLAGEFLQETQVGLAERLKYFDYDTTFEGAEFGYSLAEPLLQECREVLEEIRSHQDDELGLPFSIQNKIIHLLNKLKQ